MPAPALYAIEPLLKERIRAALAAFPALKVLSAQDLAGIEERLQHTPAVHVIADRLRPIDKTGRIAWVERWLTVVVVKNATQGKGGEASRADASPILAALVEALTGWQPSPADLRVKPLVPVPAPAPGFTAVHGYYPLAWDVIHPDTLTPYPIGA